MRTLAALLLLSAGLGFAQTTSGDVKKETAEAYDATKRYANERKDEFVARMDAKMKTLREDVATLKDKTKDTADATAKDLDAKAKTAEAKFHEVKKASGSAWTKLKSGVESAVDELDQGVKSARAR